MTEKELTEEVRLAKTAALVAIAVGLINVGIIMFFCMAVMKGAVVP